MIKKHSEVPQLDKKESSPKVVEAIYPNIEVPPSLVESNLKNESDENKIYTVTEEKAEFPGGELERSKFIQKRINYPEEAQDDGIEGRVIIEFVVEKDGSLSEIVCKRDIGGGCGKEAVRLVSQMPKWKPAIIKGKPVRSRLMMPILFRLE